jgi:RimK family alpha-L-glutamate ligase
MPLTLTVPMTYTGTAEAAYLFFDRAEARLGYPMVLKECFGSLGGQVYLARDREELLARVKAIGARPFILQQFIYTEPGRCDAGRDKRLYVVSGEVIAAIRRYSDTDFRANIGNGAKGEPYTPTEEETALAVRSCALLGLGFGGVDLLDGPDGPLVCEVNSNAFMRAAEGLTGTDIAGNIVKYIMETEKGRKL